MNDAEFEKALKDAVLSAIGDDDDLIRRGDALNAIRESCISEHLPFDSYSPEGQRTLKALNAVRTVKRVTVSATKEPQRPTAHIIRGTVRYTYDGGFCSRCKRCINANYHKALAKSYSYCPHCGARMEELK